jgi:uncharacterized protein YndB with AHSA1/START domain
VRELIAELERVERRVGGGGDGHVVELTRAYDATVEDLWDACTRPERVVRWFLPLSGDLRPGGSYQLEGNAGGRIEACEPPRHLRLTWVFGEQQSLVEVDLAALADDRARLRLRHTVPDDDHWRQFGPGAVGVGWELGLLGLAAHLAGEQIDPATLATSPELAEVMQRGAELWGRAHAGSGVPAEVARAAAERTRAAYAGEPGPDATVEPTANGEGPGPAAG